MSNFTLKGRWHADENDTHRHFTGKVEDPGGTGLNPGDVVTVTYLRDQFVGHLKSAIPQGRYSLEGMPAPTFVLASFLRKDGVIGREAEHHGEEQVWGGEIFNRAASSGS